MKKLKKIILLSPDTVNVVSYDKPRFKKSIKVNDTIYISKMNYRDSDAYPYIYHNNKIYIGKEGSSHYTLLYYNFDIMMMDGSVGRFWTLSKIISSWGYPNKSNLMKYIKEINKQGFNINNDWFILLSVKRNDLVKLIIKNNKEDIFISLMNLDISDAKKLIKKNCL